MKIAVSCIAIALLIPISAQATFYRYQDKDGNVVMGSTLPPEADHLGYDIIGPNGNVIEHVPPPKSPEEIAKEAALKTQQSEANKAAEAQKKADALQHQQDQILLKSFTTEADLVRSRDEKLASITVLEEITQQNVRHLQKKLATIQQTIQQYTDHHQAIPDADAKLLSSTQQQLQENQNFLVKKKEEKQKINQEYQKLIERFRQITKKP